jgi:hypothetical protein
LFQQHSKDTPTKLDINPEYPTRRQYAHKEGVCPTLGQTTRLGQPVGQQQVDSIVILHLVLAATMKEYEQ